MAMIKVHTKPWNVPNYVLVSIPGNDGPFATSPSLELKEVGSEVLSTMCDEFRAEVFKKAGKKDPRLLLQFSVTGEV